MRVIAVVIGFALLSLGGYAQQERQMKKPGEVQTALPGTNSQVVNTPTAPRQMKRGDSKVVTTNNVSTSRQTEDNKREMVPLNPNLVVRKKN